VSGPLPHTLFSVGFITIMCGFRFSVQTTANSIALTYPRRCDILKFTLLKKPHQSWAATAGLAWIGLAVVVVMVASNFMRNFSADISKVRPANTKRIWTSANTEFTRI
jgi:hypothetical protein